MMDTSVIGELIDKILELTANLNERLERLEGVILTPEESVERD